MMFDDDSLMMDPSSYGGGGRRRISRSVGRGGGFYFFFSFTWRDFHTGFENLVGFISPVLDAYYCTAQVAMVESKHFFVQNYPKISHLGRFN